MTKLFLSYQLLLYFCNSLESWLYLFLNFITYLLTRRCQEHIGAVKLIGIVLRMPRGVESSLQSACAPISKMTRSWTGCPGNLILCKSFENYVDEVCLFLVLPVSNLYCALKPLAGLLPALNNRTSLGPGLLIVAGVVSPSENEKKT